MRAPRKRIALLAGGAVLAALGVPPGEALGQPSTSGYPLRTPGPEVVTGSAGAGGVPVSRPGWKPQVIATARPVGTEPAGPRAAVIAPAALTAPSVSASSAAPAPPVRVSSSSPATNGGAGGSLAAMPRVEGPDPPELLPGLDGTGGSRAARGVNVGAAAVGVEKVAPPGAVPGQPFGYEIVVRNGGGSPALGVRVEEQLPAGARLVASEPAAETRGQSLVWSIGRLAAGAEARIKVQVLPGQEGEFVSTAVLTSASSCTLRVPVARAGLAVALEAPGAARVGEAVPLKIRLSNGQSTPVKRVVLRVRLPEGLKHPAGEFIEAELPGLAAGEKTVVPLEARASGGGRQPSTVTVSAEGVNPVTAVAVVTVEARGSSPFLAPGPRAAPEPTALEPIPPPACPEGPALAPGMPPVAPPPVSPPRPAASTSLAPPPPVLAGEGEAELLVKVSGRESQVEIGGESVYEVRVVNTGARAARDLRVRVLLPEGLDLVEAGGMTEASTSSREVTFTPVADLAARSAVVYAVRVRAARAGAHRLRARAQEGPGGPSREAEAVARVVAGPAGGPSLAGPDGLP